jgi:hypothetical protein
MTLHLFSTLLGALFFFPFFAALCGGLRYQLGWSLPLSLTLGLIVSVFFFFKQQEKFKLKSFSQVFICLGLFLIFFLRLDNSSLGHLINFGCADAANHLSLYQKFISTEPQTYHGFNAAYVAWYNFEQVFRFDRLQALVLVQIMPLFSLSYLIAYFFRNERAWLFGLLALIVSELVLLPIIHYNQVDGYLAHLFSISVIVPTLLLANNFSIAALFFLIVCCRFSYGLQLPDLLAAFGVYLAIKATNKSDLKHKLLLFALAALCLCACAAVIIKLMPVFSAAGSIVSQRLDYAFAAQIAGIAVLLVLYFGIKSKANSFIINFLITSSALQAMWLLITEESEYYFSKLFVYSSIALGLILIKASAALFSFKQPYLVSSWILTLAFVVVAQRPYLESYYERVQPSGQYRLLSPLLDQKVKEIIDEVLDKEQKSFAAYYTSRWAQFSFFNAFYNRPFDFERFKNPTQELATDSCIFWSSNSNDIPRLERYSAANSIEWFNKMNADKLAKTVKYNSRWAGRQVIRYLCR